MPMRALLLSLGFAVALAGCQRDAADTTTPTPAKSPVTASTSHDALSYAEPDKVAITDLSLDLKVDFDTKTIAGTATYTLDWKDENARQLVLDTRDLAIDRVEGEGQDGAWQPLQYGLADRDQLLGSKFPIAAPERNEPSRLTSKPSPEASGPQRKDRKSVG